MTKSKTIMQKLEKKANKASKHIGKEIAYILSVPAAIGIIAFIILAMRVGKDAAINSVLSWIVGLTILSTVLFSMFKAFGYKRRS